MKESRFRKAFVFFEDKNAGILEETERGYRFTYDDTFMEEGRAISVTLPITRKVYESNKLFPFFLGLLPEGWYFDIVGKKFKIDEKDAFGFLLATCKDTAGAVAIKEMN